MSRYCRLCGKDISYRGNRSIRCESCQKTHYTIWNKEYQKKWFSEHRESHRKSDKKYYDANKEKITKKHLDWFKTENGKLSSRKTQHRRDRDLGFVELFINPFPDDIDVHYHHINNLLVIPIPKSFHISTYGINHREKCNNIIKDLYYIDVEDLLNG